MNVDALIEQLGWTLVHTMWQGVVAAAVLAVALRLMRRSSASARYLTGCFAMLLLIGGAIATFYLLRPPAPVVSQPLAVSPPAPMATPSPVPSVDSRIAQSSEPQRHDILRPVVLAWLTGVAAMSLWHVGGWLWLMRLRRGRQLERWRDHLARLMRNLRITRPIALIETASIDVPAVIGVFRPVILVPIGVFSGLSPQQVEAILAHELAHIRRHDYLINLIQAAIETLMFYHPGAWWISSRIRCERENCCDDMAACACGDARSYASALATLEQLRIPRRGALAASATGGDLLSRVRRILRLPPAPQQRMRFRSLAAATLAIACVAVPLLVTAQEKKPEGSTELSTSTTKAGNDLPSPSPIEAADFEANATDYRIGAKDLINVSITDLVAAGVETVKSCRVTETGNISLPLIGVLKVAGLTEAESETAIAKAFQEKKVIDNARVSVTVAEARQSSFSILGSVDRPGQYQLTQSDFRVLDALAMSGGRPSDIASLRVIRAAQEGKPQRVLEIPLDRLAAGDAGVNVVIRPRDMLIAAPRERGFVRIVVSQDAMLHDGKPIDIDGIRRLLDTVAEPQRRRTVLEVAAASPNVTVERFFTATAALSRIVSDYKLEYLSQTGIAPSTQPVKAEPGVQSHAQNQYFVNGGVARAGVFSFAGGQQVNVKQAIAAAGGLSIDVPDVTVRVIRRDNDRELNVIDNVLVADLFKGREKDINLQAGDIVQISPPPTGEYYIDGQVPRTGVYSLTARKISVKQALAAAGGLENGFDDAEITIIRREGAKGELIPMKDVRLSDILTGKHADEFLQPNDIVRVRGKGGRAASAPATAPSASNDPARHALLRQLDELESQRAELLSKYGRHHPHVKRVDMMSAQVQRNLEEYNRQEAAAAAKQVK